MKEYYALLFYTDMSHTCLNGLFFFEKIKHMIDFTGNVLKYTDIHEKTKKYKTYKNYFKVIKVYPKIKY